MLSSMGRIVLARRLKLWALRMEIGSSANLVLHLVRVSFRARLE